MSEVRRKQTARKTTGNHAKFINDRHRPPWLHEQMLGCKLQRHTTTHFSGPDTFKFDREVVVSPAASKDCLVRVTVIDGHTIRSSVTNDVRVTRSMPKSILKRPSSNGVAVTPSPPALVPSTSTSPSTSSVDVPLSFAFSASSPGPDPDASTSKALIRRRPAVGVLDKPISVCTRFATWLENQSCVRDDALLRAIERDGDHFLRLAKATVMFDDAVRGHVPPTGMNGTAAPRSLGEHARMLRAFSQLLQFKISQDSLSEELETAVLRDGEPLLRFALSCLDFDQLIRGSGGGVC